MNDQKDPKGLSKIFEGLKHNWGLISESGIWIFGIISSFLIPVPYEYDYSTLSAASNATEHDQTIALGRFIATVLLGLLFPFFLRWNAKRHVWYWVGLTIVSLLAFISLYVIRQDAVERCVLIYDGHSILIGENYTSYAEDYLKKNPNETVRSLIDEVNVSRLDKIWTTDSMFECRHKLFTIYLGLLPLAVISLLTTIQIFSCLNRS